MHLLGTNRRRNSKGRRTQAVAELELQMVRRGARCRSAGWVGGGRLDDEWITDVGTVPAVRRLAMLSSD
jgi:hypothetical protein